MCRKTILVLAAGWLAVLNLWGCSGSEATSKCAGRVCNDQIDCTSDSCDKVTGECVYAPDDSRCGPGEECKPDSGCQAKPCGQDRDCDDGLYCNGAESCTNGSCLAGILSCDDSVACTADSCDEDADSCVHVPDDGQCGSGEVCDPTVGCIGQGECTRDQDCDDGLYCNGAETCQAPDCVSGAAVDCDDAVGCTLDACDEDNHACSNVPDHGSCQAGEVCDPDLGCVSHTCSSDGDCDDGFFCNGEETCQNNACVAGALVLCDDFIDCTEDACNEVSDRCVFLPVHELCGPGGVCDPDQGGCVSAPCSGDGDCDDGLYCNGAETCQAQACASGTPPDCSDTVDCTQDICDEANDLCLHTPDNSACDNGLFCDGDEICDELLGCRSGTAVDCSDTSECTRDVCDEANDQCGNTALVAGTPCAGQDGNYCTSSCNAAGVCNAAAVDCSDGEECTDDECDPADGSCSNTPLASGTPCAGADGNPCTSSCGANGSCDDAAAPVCDDGLYCNGLESCDPSLGCLPGTDPCDDSADCTMDSCNEIAGSCTNTQDDTFCDDGLYCNGAETCNPASSSADPDGCVSGTAVVCTPSGPCLTATCSETLGSCQESPEDQDGDGHPPLACGGDDCDDQDPDTYLGAPETCDGDDNDCDTEIDEGFGAYRDPCVTGADCCSGNCVAGNCDFPVGSCLPLFSLCTSDDECCSNLCGLDIVGVLRCQSDAMCAVAGSACTRATDCCSMYCVSGICSTGNMCIPDGGTCTSDQDCCSNICAGGTCDSAAGNCAPLGEICSSSGNCCSNVCTQVGPGESRCNFYSECLDEGEHCTDDSDCCNCLCEASGLCGSPGACSTAFESCGGWGECCSRLCVNEPSGTGVCRFVSGCLSEGELCDPNCVRTCAQCCSGVCETKTTGGLTTSRCTKGGSCLPAGHVCGGTGTSNCCAGGSAQCRMTRTGNTRCFGDVYPGQCLADGLSCAFSDQCCSGYCLPDADGNLTCEPTCAGPGEPCTASADCCSDQVIQKCENCICVESDMPCIDVGGRCQSTEECCFGVCDDLDRDFYYCVLL